MNHKIKNFLQTCLNVRLFDCDVWCMMGCLFSTRWMGRTYQEPAMRRRWRLSALPKTPLWFRCSVGNRCLWVKGHLRMSSWWMCAHRQTSPSSTSWLLPNSGLAAHLCQTFALSCSQTGKNWTLAKMEYSFLKQPLKLPWIYKPFIKHFYTLKVLFGMHAPKKKDSEILMNFKSIMGFSRKWQMMLDHLFLFLS